MWQDRPAALTKRERLERQEEDTWLEFYPQARKDPSLAAEILTELERDETLRRRHRGLYLCCQRCIRLNDSREARYQRIGHATRRMFNAVFIALPLCAMDLAKKAGHLMAACLPDAADDQGDRRHRQLMEGDAYAQAGRSLRERARKAADRSDAPDPERTLPES
ncbi:hypothetical protein [Pseudorhodoferax soli]|uniref:Uncharacterized protein n=1 Tax=Pseudorhodoferax soli TaxID=545864 RepID=A0A368XNH9_9BURK|nr:hypothetical protein [Pseudorhodoferax soli]RCW69551.1 hypothetical protein DES41_106425 [Pseudorhodoferax soli]